MQLNGRPRVLMLVVENPWTLSAGGLIRNYWIARALTRRFDVDLVTADRPDHAVPADFQSACASIGSFPPPPRNARIVRALAPGRSFFTAAAVSTAMRTAVAGMLAGTEYAAIVYDLAMIDAIPRGCVIPLIYNAHNCEAALLQRRAARERGLLRRAAIAIDAKRVGAIEARAVEQSVLVAACSKEDIADLAELASVATTRSIVVPNGVDVGRYAGIVGVPPTPGRVLVTGSFDWHPNRIGLRWFLADVLPRLRASIDDGTLHVRVAGRMDAALAAEINGLRGATAAPNVADMRVELAAAEMVAAPILASSGTRLRILEAWASGRPVITTTAGAFGLPARNGEDLVVCDDADAFAGAITGLARNAPGRDSIRRAGLRQAAAFDWQGIGETLLAACAQRVPMGATS